VGWILICAFAAVRAACFLAAREIGLAATRHTGCEANGVTAAFSSSGTLLALSLSFALGLHLDAVRLLILSFDLLPPGSSDPAPVLEFCGRLVTAAGQAVFAAAVSLALPVFAVAGLVSIVQGVLGRMWPQAEVQSLVAPIRILLGLGAVSVLLPQSLDSLRAHVLDAVALAAGLFRWMST
jgi:flagellar biosynthesis protein FliR